MSELHPCPACRRHVRGSACPFCGSAVESAARIATLGSLSRAMVFASATLAVAACGGKQKKNDDDQELMMQQQQQVQNHPCGVDQSAVDAAQKKVDEAKTDDERKAAEQELEQAKMPVCAPYGAPPARRRVV